MCAAFIHLTWWSCQPKIIWIVSDDLVRMLMGHIFLQNARLHAFLRLFRCTVVGNKGLSSWTRLHLLRLSTTDPVGWWGDKKAFSAFKFHPEEIPKNKNLWASAIVCRTWIWRSGSAFEIACVSFFLPLHLWVWRFAQHPPLRLQARKLYQGSVPVKKNRIQWTSDIAQIAIWPPAPLSNRHRSAPNHKHPLGLG